MFTAMRNRRVRAWLALPLLMLLLAACARSTELKGPTFTGTLTLWASADLAGHPGRLDDGWLEERAKAYAASHKGVTVQVRTVASGEELEKALLTDPSQPDLYFGRPLLALGDRLATLTLQPDLVSDHHEGALAAFRRGTALFGLPALLDLQVLALNDQAFSARSVPLPRDGRWTDPEWADTLAKLSGSGLFSLGFSHTPGYHQWWPLIGGGFAADGSVAAGAEAGLGRLAHWRKAGYIAPDVATLGAEESYNRFAANPAKIAMLPIPSWAIPLLRSEPFRATFTVAGFPGDTNAGYAYGFVALANQETARLTAVVDLIAYMAAPDQQVRLARRTGLMPARKSAPNPFEGDPHMTRAFQLAGTYRPLPAGPAWDSAQAKIAHELLLALYGGKKPAEALQAAQTHYHTATTSAR